MKKQPNWTTEELDALEDIAVNYPSDRLTELYNRWASRHDHVQRTRQALITKLSRCGMDTRMIGEWVSAGYVRQILGVGHDTPQRWTDRGWVTAHQDSRGRRCFRRQDLRQMARDRPATFGGIDPNRVFLLLEDRQLADDIAARYPRRAMDPRPVRAIETGWRFPSIRAAAEHVFISRQAITSAIRTGGTAAGYHWSFT